MCGEHGECSMVEITCLKHWLSKGLFINYWLTRVDFAKWQAKSPPPTIYKTFWHMYMSKIAKIVQPPPNLHKFPLALPLGSEQSPRDHSQQIAVAQYTKYSFICGVMSFDPSFIKNYSECQCPWCHPELHLQDGQVEGGILMADKTSLFVVKRWYFVLVPDIYWIWVFKDTT